MIWAILYFFYHLYKKAERKSWSIPKAPCTFCPHPECRYAGSVWLSSEFLVHITYSSNKATSWTILPKLLRENVFCFGMRRSFCHLRPKVRWWVDQSIILDSLFLRSPGHASSLHSSAWVESPTQRTCFRVSVLSLQWRCRLRQPRKHVTLHELHGLHSLHVALSAEMWAQFCWTVSNK